MTIPGELLAARYNWCQVKVPGRGPAVENHCPTVLYCNQIRISERPLSLWLTPFLPLNLLKQREKCLVVVTSFADIVFHFYEYDTLFYILSTPSSVNRFVRIVSVKKNSAWLYNNNIWMFVFYIVYRIRKCKLVFLCSWFILLSLGTK